MKQKTTYTGDCKIVMIKIEKKFFTILGISLVFFLGLAIVFGVGMYNDSVQYIDMHIHREPGYPLFLWIFRQLSETNYQTIAVILQSIFGAFATTYFVCYVSDVFSLKIFNTGMIFLAVLAPHIFTPLFSVETVILTSGLMSEALCLPLFLIYVVLCHKMLLGSKKSSITSLLVGFLLSLIRGQMMVTFLIWMVLLVGKTIASAVATGKQTADDMVFTETQASDEIVHNHRSHRVTMSKRILWILGFTLLAFIARSYTVKTYNLIFNDYFINTTYTGVNTFTNVLYVTDLEDGEKIEDLEMRELFYDMHALMDQQELSYEYATGSIAEKIGHLENTHDDIKFYAVESILREYFHNQGVEDYILQDVKSDQWAMIYMKELLPSNFWQWVVNYIGLAWNGVIRSIGVVHPIVNIYVGLAFASSIALMIYHFIKSGIKSKHGWLLAIAILSICAISFSTALTIMCLSRYMIYGFSGFYVALYLGGLEFLKERIGNQNEL